MELRRGAGSLEAGYMGGCERGWNSRLSMSADALTRKLTLN